MFRANPQFLPAQVVASLSGAQQSPPAVQTKPGEQQPSPQRQIVSNPPVIVTPIGQAASHVPQQKPPAQQSPSLSQVSPRARHVAWQIRSTHASEQQLASAWQVLPVAVQHVPSAPQRCVLAQQVLTPVGEVQTWLLGQHPSPTQTDPAGQQPPKQVRSAGQQMLFATQNSPATQQKPAPMPQCWLAGQQVPLLVQDWFASQGAHAAPAWPHVAADWRS